MDGTLNEKLTQWAVHVGLRDVTVVDTDNVPFPSIGTVPDAAVVLIEHEPHTLMRLRAQINRYQRHINITSRGAYDAMIAAPLGSSTYMVVVGRTDKLVFKRRARQYVTSVSVAQQTIGATAPTTPVQTPRRVVAARSERNERMASILQPAQSIGNVTLDMVAAAKQPKRKKRVEINEMPKAIENFEKFYKSDEQHYFVPHDDDRVVEYELESKGDGATTLVVYLESDEHRFRSRLRVDFDEQLNVCGIIHDNADECHDCKWERQLESEDRR